MSSDTEGMASSSKTERPLSDQEKRGLQLPTRKKNDAGKTVTISMVRHAVLAATDKESGKKNGSHINQIGHYRPCACMPCLLSLGTAKPEFKLGQFSKTSMMLLSCVVDKTYGRNKVCGRCLSLNNTESRCLDPPRTLLPEVRALVKAVPEYNKILQANPDKLLQDFAGADKTALEKTIKMAKDLSLAFNGYLKEHPETRATPMKRKFEDAFTDGKDLAKIADSADDVKNQLRIMSTAIGDIAKKQRKIIEDQQRILLRLKCSRERERYLLDAVQHLNEQAAEDANWSALDPFDLANADCLSDEDPDEVDDDDDEGV